MQGETLTSPATQKTETQSLEIGSSSEQDAQGNLEKAEVLSQKGGTTLTNQREDKTKYQAEALIKNGQEKPPFTPDKSSTNTAEK